jgi:NAD(P)-dependent dehydrogenase (short-subunit alcohol dehydrogenase family)
MDLGIKGKKALVTAAGRGIGQSVALLLAQEGVQVAVVSRTEEDLVQTVSQMDNSNKGHIYCAADLTAEGAPAQLIETLKAKHFWPIDIAMHNLGGDLNIKDPFCDIEDWRKVWRINVEVAVELNRLLVPPMREKHWGRIVHTSSIASAENQGAVTYCSVKAALNAYTRSMGRVLAPDGIVMTAVLPGAVMTEGGYWDIASRERPEHVEKYLAERMAIRRFGEPEEISNFVVFLCSELASFCIGSIIPIDGGQGRTFFGL